MTDPESIDKLPHIHVVYEYGIDYRPHASPFLRLIRPFSHPRVKSHFNTTFDQDYYGDPADLVIIDRLWRPDVTLPLVQELVNRIQHKGARLIYSLDDNFFDLMLEGKGWPPMDFLPIVVFLLSQANGVLVSTPALRERLLEYNPNIHVLPNHLDERLLVIRHPDELRPLGDSNRLVIGYMGTFTHDEDFLMVLPALKAIRDRFQEQIDIQVIGVVRSEEIKKELQQLSVRYIHPKPDENEYPLFMLWFTGHVRWDIAISPLRGTPFNQCKSDIKYLDYAAIGASGIFSRSPAYNSTIHQKENGLMVENTPEAWEDALETLIQNSSLRLKIARNATRHLYSERILAQRAPDFVDIVERLINPA